MAGPRKKRSPAEAQLDALQPAADAASSPEARALIQAALRGGAALAAARAAGIVKEHALDGLGDDLCAAFRRFMQDPARSDPGCRAKLAALEALDYGEHSDAAPFLEATRHVQKEGAWGPPVDTATGVRARGVLALSRLDHADLPLVAGALLADAEPPVRQAAAEALGASRRRENAGMLILRLEAGDQEPLVSMACMAALLELAPDHAVPRLRALLLGRGDGDRDTEADEAARETAALALAQSKRDDALDVLLEHLERAPSATERAPTLRALGLHRSDRALAAALEVIATGDLPDATAALSGLAARRFDPGVRERVDAAVKKNDGADLREALRSTFDRS